MTAQEITTHDVITFNDLKELASARPPCITILAPVPTPFELSPRLKNAMRHTQSKLEERAGKGTSTDALMGPIRELAMAAETAGLWSNSLILFRSPDVFRYYRLYRSVPQAMEAAEDRFQIRPLLAALGTEQRFHVLGLSRKHIRLLDCTQYRTEEARIDNVVQQDMREWLKIRQPDHVLDNRAVAGPSVGSMKGVTFGTSADRERENEYVSHFFKEVDKGLNTLLRADSAPLLLAGVESEVAIYRRVSSNPRLHEKAVNGSPDGLPDQELHRRAMEQIMQSYSKPVEKALSDFEKYRDTGRISTDHHEIVRAAWEGRVLDLLISEGAELRGTWNEEKRDIETDNPREDLLNAAALQTVLHGGQAFVLEAKKMPLSQEAVAVLRF